MNLEYPARALKRNASGQAAETPQLDGRTVPASHLFRWLRAGALAALAQPMVWMACLALCAALLMLFKALPLLRPLAALAAPLIAGALMYALDRQRNGEPVELADIARAVYAKANPLLAIGLMSGAIVAIGYVIMIATLNLSLLASIMTTGMRAVSISYGGDDGLRGMLESLVSAPILTIAVGAAWFAPALVMLHDVAPFEAMKASLNGAARNWGASAVWLVVLTGAALLAPTVPLLASALVLTPLMLLSIYDGYRDVFVKR